MHLRVMLTCIALLYLLFRFGAALPPWALPAFNLGFVAVAAWFVVTGRAFRRRAASTDPAAPVVPKPPQHPLMAALQTLLMLAVLAGLLFPLGLVLYFVWLGGQLWR